MSVSNPMHNPYVVLRELCFLAFLDILVALRQGGKRSVRDFAEVRSSHCECRLQLALAQRALRVSSRDMPHISFISWERLYYILYIGSDAHSYNWDPSFLEEHL